ncbi:hypothetical protein AA906_00975 [Geobacillus stearothermophilus]|nr:hypothetical protein AA906_00975 [Geobacillus stearothermophilus]
MLCDIGLQEFGVPRRSDVPAQFRGSSGQHKLFDLFLLFFGEKRLSPGGEIPMKQEFKAAFVEQRHIMGNSLSAHVDHGGHLFAQIAFHDQANRHHPLAKKGVFDFPFLFAKCPRCPSMIVGDFETFHAEFRSFSMFFIRSSITGVGTAYAKVNFSMSMYIYPSRNASKMILV